MIYLTFDFQEDSSYLPERIYYQINNRSAFENFKAHVNKRNRQFQQMQAYQKFVLKCSEQQLKDVFSKTIIDIVKL